RQDALDGLGILDQSSDVELDRLTTLVSDLFGMPFAAVTLIDSNRQSTASTSGMNRVDIARKEAFCNIAIRRPEALVIHDAPRDPRYRNFVVVKDNPKIRFYAGYPIESKDGQRIGALCVMDVEPRSFTKGDSALLREVAQRVQERLWALSERGEGELSDSA
ncbi:MAG: GAF domain-containing protein, partial [Rhodoglobus sp.]|nr:GAF domain-containing protein [Rhodoglobus sp.]